MIYILISYFVKQNIFLIKPVGHYASFSLDVAWVNGIYQRI